MSNAQGCQCGQAHGSCTEFQYAVKLVGGQANVASSPFPPYPPVAVGKYWTATNLHNPDKCKKAHFRVKLAVANPLRAGPVSAYQGPYDLGPDEAFEIDSADIIYLWSLFFPGQSAPTFVKGYLVIESDIELDVVAVYTGAAAANQLLTTFQTERVQPRCIPLCEDFVLPLYTGVAAWQTVASTVGGPLGPVANLATNAAWTAPLPFGAQWVSQNGTDGVDAPSPNAPTTRIYKLCFDLCYGFAVLAPISIQVLADDTAIVRLNTIQVGVTVPYNTPTNITVPINLLQAGQNCFQVEVTNRQAPITGKNPTGFALAGMLSVARGKCPCAPLPIVGASQGQGAAGTPATTLFDHIAAASKAS